MDVSCLLAITRIFSGFVLGAKTKRFETQADVIVDTPACRYFKAIFSS
jgi:hypothetical protein